LKNLSIEYNDLYFVIASLGRSNLIKDFFTRSPRSQTKLGPRDDRRIIRAISVLLFCAYSSSAQEIWTIKFDPKEPAPGQTLKIELKNAPERATVFARFKNKTYPFYTVKQPSPHKRALVGIAGDCPAGQYPLEIYQRGWLRKRKIWQKEIVVIAKEFPKEVIELKKDKTSLIEEKKGASDTAKIRQRLKKLTSEQLWQGVFDIPTQGRQTSIYGIRRVINNDIPWNFHKGLDLGAPEGTPAYAPGGGHVVLAEPLTLQGNCVLLDHGQGVYSIYMHLSEIGVRPGQLLKKGEFLGKVGSTGIATAAHLHWGIYVNGDAVDPAEWLTRKF